MGTPKRGEWGVGSKQLAVNCKKENNREARSAGILTSRATCHNVHRWTGGQRLATTKSGEPRKTYRGDAAMPNAAIDHGGRIPGAGKTTLLAAGRGACWPARGCGWAW